jgi:hypothetical protein
MRERLADSHDSAMTFHAAASGSMAAKIESYQSCESG